MPWITESSFPAKDGGVRTPIVRSVEHADPRNEVLW